ncbi:MAG: fatty acid desaturase, partial [Saprospiraceae bacterium]|nr:fatty acid desaturase [Saprospiraceae bacterium]
MRENEIRVALKDWQKIVVKYSTPDSKLATVQLLNTFLPFIAIWTLMYFLLDWSYGVTLIFALLNGFLLARLFIIQHDCGHQCFVKSRRWNNRIGFVCSLFTSLPYTYWARVHNYHHGHVGQLEHRDVGDINFLTVKEFKEASKTKKVIYRIFRNPFFLFILTPIIYLSISNRYPFFKFKGWSKIRRSQIINNLVLIGVYVLLGWLLGWKAFLM